MKYILLVLVLVIEGCAFNPITISEVTDIIAKEWNIGQSQVASLIGKAAFSVAVTEFEIRAKDGVFNCGGVQANGCFSTRSRRISWNTKTPTVIRHEAGHAILWQLDYDCWETYEHTEYPWGCI